MASNGGRINFQVGYNVDNSQLNKIKGSLQELQKIKIADFSGTREDLKSIKDTAAQVQTALEKAFNVNLNSLNVQKFNEQLKTSGLSIDGIYQSFSKAGAQGQVAFSRMASSVLTTNMQLKETNSLVSQMGETMANTVKWGIASSVMNSFSNSVQQAFQYVKSLDSALTDIRIVTGDSTEKMADFAVQANNAAQALGRSTMDYSKAALSFYQQGLSDQDVQARTQSVLQAQNITGAGQEMADYLTAVWNGYKVANEEAELYVDKLAAVADSSASNMSQLAIAMSKVASTANAMGVDVDSLNAQIATIIATTRQAPESVGNALKTIYARINDIATGSDDAQVSLGNYSKQMAEVGVSVLDTQGRLRDTQDVIEQVGQKWADLSREQQIYLARTMAGQRQYNNLIALFDNWGNYTELVNTSLDSQGTLVEKNGRYLESLGAKMEQLGAAGERVKSALIDQNDLKNIVDFGTNAVNLFGSLIESIGGGKNAVLAFGSIFAQIFSGTIAKEINNIVTNIQNARNNAQALQNDIKATQTFGASQGYQSGAIKEMVDAKREMQQYYSVMSSEQINSYNNIVKQIGASKEQVLILEKQVEAAEKFSKALEEASKKDTGTGNLSDQIVLVNQQAEQLAETLQSLKGKNALQVFNDDSDIFGTIQDQVDRLKVSVGEEAVQAFKNFEDAVQQVENASPKEMVNALSAFRNAAQQVFNQVYTGNNLVLGLDEIKASLAQANASLQLSKQKVEEYKQSIAQFSNVKSIVDTVSAFAGLASALNSIKNLGSIWTNQNLSGGEKLLQTVTNLGMAIPMLVTNFNKLKDTSLLLSQRFTNQAQIQQALQKVEEAQAAVQTAKTAIEQAQIAAKQGNAAATASLTFLKEEEAVATQQAAIAQQELNIAMGANPIGMLMIGISAAIAGITALVKIYDHFHMSLNEAGQAIENFNAKQEELQNNTQKYKQTTSELAYARREYEQLAKKAGASTFDSSIDELTQKERERYNQIKNLIVEYNEDALAGYNDQGQAILLNNSYLEQTIELLKEKHQLQIDETYGGDQFRDAQQGKRVEYQAAQERVSEAEENVRNVSSGETFTQAINKTLDFTSLATNNELFQQQVDKLIQIQKDGVQKVSDHQEELDEIYKSISEKAARNEEYLIQSQIEDIKQDIQGIKQTGRDIQQADYDLQAAKKDAEEKSKIAAEDIIGVLSTTAYNQEYSGLAQQYGQALINSLITGYTEGFTWDDFDSVEAAAQEVREKLLISLSNIGITKQDLTTIQDSIKERSGEINFGQLTGQQYKIQVSELINQVYGQNAKLKELASSNPEVFNALLQSLFGLDEIETSFTSDGKLIVNKIVDEYTKIKTEAESQIDSIELPSVLSKRGKEQIQSQIGDWIDSTSLDRLQHFDQIIQATSIDLNDVSGSLDKAARQVQTLASVSSSADTLGLLTKRAQGETLSDDELGSLITGLQNLKETYPELSGEVEFLNQKWVEGTALYQKALEDVKNAVFDSFASIGQYTDQIKQKMSDLIVVTEDLQIAAAQNPELLDQDPQWYSQQLIKIASGYESCTDELNKYVVARHYGNEAEQQAAQFTLELAARSEQNAQAYGIESERISQVAKRFVEYAEAGKEGYEGLQNNAQLAADAATRYLRLNDAVADLVDNLDDYKEVLEEASEYGTESVRASQDMNQTFSNLKETVADLLDTSSELLGDDWIVDNMDNILAAAQGNEQALKALQEAATEEILINLGVDTSSLDMTTSEVAEWANNLPEGQLSLDDTVFLNQLVWAMQQAGLGRTEIESALSGMNFDVDLAPYKAGLNQAIDDAYQASDAIVSNLGFDAETKSQTKEDTDTTQVAGYTATPVPMSADVAIPQIAEQVTPFGILPTFAGITTSAIQFSGISVTPNIQPIDSTKQTTATALMVKNARKKSGGNIAHSARKAPSGNTGKKGGGGGKGKSPKKSSGSTKKPTTQSKQKLSEAKDTVKERSDPYHDINIALDKQEDKIEKIQKAEKKLLDKDRLKNIKSQNKQLEKQKDLLDTKSGIAASELVRLRNELVSDLGKNIKFDANGQIANYNQALDKALANYNKAISNYNKEVRDAQNAYNNYVSKYNSMTAQQQEAAKAELQKQKQLMQATKKQAQRTLEVEKKRYQTIKDNVKEYQQTLELQKDLADQIEQIQEQIYDNLIAMSKIKVDLSIDTGQAERDWLDFENKFIKKLNDKDYLGQAKANIKELMSYFNSKEVQQVANQINSIRKQIAIMEKGGTSSIYGTNLAQAKEDLEDYYKQQMQSLQDIQDIVDDIKDNYLDAIDDAKDKMDDQIDQYERVNDLIQHNVKLTQLLYGDKAYNTMDKYYNLQQQNNQKQLESLRNQQQYWQQKMNQQVVGSDAWKKFKENLDDVTDDLNSKLEDMIENLADQWQNRVDGIIDKLNNALTGGRGLDYLDEQWDYINNFDDNFLDTVESKMGIEQVQRLYQQAIDGLTGDPAQQQKINKLMNQQLKILKEKDNLTQYDLDRAKALLEVEQARMALEDVRYNKTKMRLRRDSQGNYTYQYVADEQKLTDLQSALADAQANLYNMDKEHYKENLDTLYDTYKDYIEKMRDLTEEYNSTQDAEERSRIQARIDLLKESTSKLMEGLTQDNKYALQYLNQSFFDAMGIDSGIYTAEEQLEIMNQNIPQMSSNIQDLADTIVGQGGILNATADAMVEINKATKEYDQNIQSVLKTAGTSLNTVTQVVDSAGNALDKNIKNAQNLITTNEELMKSIKAEIESIEKLMSYLDKYLDKVMNVQSLIGNLRNAYNTIQQTNGSNLTADKISAEDWNLDTTAGLNYTGNPATDAATVKKQIDALMAQYQKFLASMAIATFDTGGATGSWDDASGRLAFLHQKELVLNQDDTKNILSAVEAVRSMTLSLNGMANGDLSSVISQATGLLGGLSTTSQLDQNVHIEANFPNVTKHTEIEQAFNNLVNMASMHASGYRD